MSLKEKLRSQLAVKIYIAASSAFILLFVLDAWVMPAIVHSRAEIAIPDVRGKNAAEAMRILRNADLTPVVTDTVAHERIRVDHVVFQNPPGKTIVREGRNVYLTVSGGEERIAMPNLRGRSLRDARITLELANLKVGNIAYESSELPPETVTGQSIPPGKTVRKNSTIGITVSGGASTEMEVPDVVNLSLDQAQQLLIQSGLRPGAVNYRQSNTLMPNTVIAQSPAAGTVVAPNTAIDLTVVH